MFTIGYAGFFCCGRS